MRRACFLLVLAGCSSGASTSDAGVADASGDAAADVATIDSPADAAPLGWKPGTDSLPWQWELDHTIVTTNATDMGTGDPTYAGGAVADPSVYDVDGFDNGAAEMSALHALGKKVICYIEVGAAENDRPHYG